MNAKQLRQILLNEAEDIVKEKIAQAKGKSGPLGHTSHTNMKKEQDKIWDVLVPIIQQANDTQRVEAESTHDVIGLLKEGTVSFAEAKDLMHMLSTKSEIDDLKKLLENMDDLQISNQ